MILPTKHIPTRQSLLGLGGTVLDKIRVKQTVTRLWETCRHHPDIKSYHQFILALDFLYAIGALEIIDGEIRRARP